VSTTADYRLPVASKQTLTLLSTIAGVALARFDELTVLVVADIERQLPELAADAGLRESLGVAVSENLGAALRLLANPDVGAPPTPRHSLDHARRMAQRGLPLSALLRAYRVGQAVFQQYIIGEVAHASSDATVVAEGAQLVSAVSFSHVDRVSGEVVQAYQTERDYWQHQRIAARSTQVDSLLSGRTTDLDGFERALGYVVEQQHLAVVLWTDMSEDALPSLERAAGALASSGGCLGHPLVVARDVSTVWAWLPSPSRQPDAALSAGTRAALGTTRSGLSGFRASHVEALETQRVVTTAAPTRRLSTTSAAAVGPLRLLCDDVVRLRSWVLGVLGALALDDASTEALRETLSVFLSTGRSYVHTGTQLNLHRNSVQYRVKKALDVLGGQALDRPLDLQLALLACRVLGAPVLKAR
jgi:hypothetical protein